MFTGITSDIGRITHIDPCGDLRVTIRTGYDIDGIALGASIACSGACMTVVAKGADTFAVDVSSESIGCTASGMWAQGRRLNLERSLKLGDEMGGHIVTGHVDGVGQVVSIEEVGGSHTLRIRVDAALAPSLAPKGSIAVDGVSLTVNEVEDETDGSCIFTLNIIPHTWEVTTMGDLVAGSEVNIEIDILTRYLARMKERLAA